MQFERLDAAEVAAQWSDLADILAPSFELDPGTTAETALAEILADDMTVFRVRDGADAVLLLSQGIAATGERAVWVVHLGGKVEGGPKQRRAFMQQAVRSIEDMAREIGCDEVRMEGRVSTWGRLFPDYQQDGDVLRKAV